VIAAIDLDYEPNAGRREVNDETEQRNLTAERDSE